MGRVQGVRCNATPRRGNWRTTAGKGPTFSTTAGKSNQPLRKARHRARFEQEIEALAVMRGIVAHGPRQRSEIEREIEARSANFYASFFLRQLQPDMLVLDCGCGTATITIGLAEALPAGTVIGIDLAKDSLAAARRYASVMGRENLFCAAAEGDGCRFPRRRSTRSFATPCSRRLAISRTLSLKSDASRNL